MKKKAILLTGVILFLCTSVCYAKISGNRFRITKSEKEFDVYYYLTEDMKVIKNLKNNDVDVTQSFSLSKNGLNGEIRYSLFTDTGTDDSDLQTQYALTVLMCLNNIAGYEVPQNAVSLFREEDVKKEFNADFGCTAFIQEPKSDYSKGYNFMIVEFFYKEKQGLVMRTCLFNDFEFLGFNPDGSISPSSPWFSNYHTFKFMEKDKNGKYISE